LKIWSINSYWIQLKDYISAVLYMYNTYNKLYIVCIIYIYIYYIFVIDTYMVVRQLNTNETLWTWNLKLINRIIKVISIFFEKEKNHFFYCFPDKLCQFCFEITWFRDFYECENYEQIKDIRIPRVSYSLFYRFELPLLSIFAIIRLKTILFFMFLIPTHFNTFRSNFKTRQ